MFSYVVFFLIVSSVNFLWEQTSYQNLPSLFASRILVGYHLTMLALAFPFGMPAHY